jgi:hypothetical protein
MYSKRNCLLSLQEIHICHDRAIMASEISFLGSRLYCVFGDTFIHIFFVYFFRIWFYFWLNMCPILLLHVSAIYGHHQVYVFLLKLFPFKYHIRQQLSFACSYCITVQLCILHPVAKIMTLFSRPFDCHVCQDSHSESSNLHLFWATNVGVAESSCMRSSVRWLISL